MIWDLKDPKVKQAMEKSITFNPNKETFPTALIPRRNFAVKIHENPADTGLLI